MNVNYTDSVKQWPDGYELAQKATNRLKEVLGKSEDKVSAEWGLTVDDRGRQVFSLRLNDPTGESERKITPDDLRETHRTAFHLHRVYGDLLQSGSEKLLKELIGEEG